MIANEEPQDMTQPRSTVDATFKLQVVQMIRQQGLSVAQVCRDQHLTDSAVRRWLAQFDAEHAAQPGIARLLTPEQQCIGQRERACQRHHYNQRKKWAPKRMTSWGAVKQ